MSLLRSRSRFWLGALLACTLLMLLVGGFFVKGPCVGAVWDGHQYEKRCYTDMIPLYGGRGLDESRVPYLEEFNEYPVLTGMWMYMVSLVADDRDSFFVWNAVALGVLGLAVTVVLWRESAAGVHVLWWGFAPALALYAFHNWDLLAVLFAVLAVHAYSRERYLASGVFLGLGVAAKLFPLFLVPVLLAKLWRRQHVGTVGPWWRGVRSVGLWRFSLAAMGSWLVVNLPFIVLNARMWWQTYAFHSERGPTLESHWNVLRQYADRWDLGWLAQVVGPDVLPTLSLVLLAGGVLGLALLVLTGRLGWLSGCLGSLLVFLVANQVISIQYVLWIVPFFALLPQIPWRYKAFVLIADVLVYMAVFDYFHVLRLAESQVAFEKLAVASLLRVVAVLFLLVALIIRGWREAAPAAAPAPQQVMTERSASDTSTAIADQ